MPLIKNNVNITIANVYLSQLSLQLQYTILDRYLFLPTTLLTLYTIVNIIIYIIISFSKNKEVCAHYGFYYAIANIKVRTNENVIFLYMLSWIKRRVKLTAIAMKYAMYQR